MGDLSRAASSTEGLVEELADCKLRREIFGDDVDE
jgi:hypothetical protein